MGERYMAYLDLTVVVSSEEEYERLIDALQYTVLKLGLAKPAVVSSLRPLRAQAPDA